ncbi:DUF1702 family protein [Streptomyces boluensis]|uniref:DUF1702 family protein n=1 Tax=Streptomyces boluensis TaxID=1775135 RepID=UPI0028AA3E17|nr:DUF1702 family protein [Streptomyces boluensis]
MATAMGALRRLLMAPSLKDVSFAGRGFPVVETAATRQLESIPQSVVCGFEWGIDASGVWELERRLSLVDPETRGFAYEGATMASTVRDVMGPRKGTRTEELLAGEGKRHIFLNYIGIGFAMARLPRPLWKKVMPQLPDESYYPQMSWLAVDGYGFDRAYFDTERWIDGQYVDRPYAWEGAAEYFPRAVDQGIGRALWFIHGARVDHVAAAVGRFAEGRQADLWAGVGLAATFAGCSTPEDLNALRHASGEYRDHLAQGSVFAAKARHHSGTVPEHTRTATHALAGVTVESAARLADDTYVPSGSSAAGPAYELWRHGVRARLVVNAGARQSAEHF